MPFYGGGGGAALPFDPARYSWIDNNLNHVNGLWNGSSYPYADTFGAPTSSVPTSSGDPRFRSEWSITPNSGNAGIVHHGTNILQTFGAGGVPAKPSDITSTRGLIAWCASQGVADDFMVRLEHGLPVLPLRSFYEAGYKKLTLAGYVLALPGSSSGIMGTYLSVASGGSADINAVDCNTVGAHNKINTLLLTPNGNAFPDQPLSLVCNYSISNAWQPFSQDIILTDVDYQYLYEGGHDAIQLQIILGSSGHLRLAFLFKPMLITKP